MYGSSTVESTKVAVLRFHRMLFTYRKARTKLLKRNARTISITNPPIQSALHTPLKRGGGCGRRLGLVYAGGRPTRLMLRKLSALPRVPRQPQESRAARRNPTYRCRQSRVREPTLPSREYTKSQEQEDQRRYTW